MKIDEIYADRITVSHRVHKEWQIYLHKLLRCVQNRVKIKEAG